jgi:hypothetical protein
MTFRLRFLAGAATLALPLAAMTAVIPAATAQAATPCAPDQATVTFYNGTTACQSVGLQVYDSGPPVMSVCAGPEALATVVPGFRGSPFVFPGSCRDAYGPSPETVVVAPA